MKMVNEKFPTLKRLLGSDWLDYMIACESSRPIIPKKVSYVGTLVELEKVLEHAGTKFSEDPRFSILLDFLKDGMEDKKWENFEHAFAMLKEIELITKKYPNSRLELFPSVGETEMDFRLVIRNNWIYFEVKASPMFSFEGEFLNAEIEKRLSLKIEQLDNNLFYIIYFKDLRPGQIDENAFVEFLGLATEKIKREGIYIFPILLRYPVDDPLIEVLIVDTQKPILKLPDASNENWYLTLGVIRRSIQGSHGRNHFFNHVAPSRYDLKKRLENLMRHAADKMDKTTPNVLIIHTREVVLGNVNEVYENCKDLFKEHTYTIIDAVVMNVENEDQTMHRRLFERCGSKLPIGIDSIL